MRLWTGRIAGLIAAGVVGFLGAVYDTRIWAAIFLVVAATGAYMMSVKCPMCGTPALLKTFKVFGVSFPVVMPFAGRRCSGCGLEYQATDNTKRET